MGLESAIVSLILLLSCITTLAAAESYTLTAYSPATRAIHGKPINASGRRFIIGLDAPMTYCPDVVPRDSCPPGNITTVNGDLTVMKTMVPGGQFIYIDPEGFVGFTQAHSSYPFNITTKGFHRTTAKPSSPCDPEPTVLDFCDPKDTTSKGLYACPYPDLAGTWVLVAGSARARARRGDCEQLEGLEMHDSEVELGAWQYT